MDKDLGHQNYVNLLAKTKEKLDKVSPTYCVAKWQQVTIHLPNGHTHSCHHPGTHLVPLDELKSNPSALHNTNFKKSLRKLMLEGERPSECDYCWRVEDSPGNHYSDRVRKSADWWAKDYLKPSAEIPWDANVNPSYVEVNFSNVCNFSCGYCYPHISSSIMQDVKRHGPYILNNYIWHDLDYYKEQGKIPIPLRENNPYLDAWWEWWPNLYPNLKVFRITGGEPLLSKETWRTLDWILEDKPNLNLELAINTNLGVEQDMLEKFYFKCDEILAKKLIRKITIYTSCDTQGSHAEYIRNGLNYNRFYSNLWNLCLNHPNIDVSIMCTFSLLSIPNFKNFLVDMLLLRKTPTVARKLNGHRGVNLDFPYLRHPAQWSCLIAEQPELDTMISTLDYMKEKMPDFFAHEYENLNRIVNVMKAEQDKVHDNERLDFYLFTEQYDSRYNKSLLRTFEGTGIEQFYENCKNSFEAKFGKQDITEIVAECKSGSSFHTITSLLKNKIL